MVATATPFLMPDLFLAEAGPLAAAFAAIMLAALSWQLWHSRRQSLAALAESSRQLAAEREKTLQTRQEKDTLARENKSKSEMLATLSRDIRGHLNGIMGSADLLIDPSLQPRQREHLTTLRASAESLHQSLNDVLDYSNLETGQIQIARTNFDLQQPLTDVVEALSPLALLKGLELVLIVAPDAPLQVNGDAARLRQVLLNLMSNAVKFTAQGRVVLRVTVSPGSAAVSKHGGTWLHFSVSDTGPGIPAEMQATLFDHPSGPTSASPRNFGGAGLELAISKRLVELMGGRIGARNLAEGGSEYWVVLALPTEKEAAPPAPHHADLHVAVLDDLAAARVAASALLARLGFEHDTTDTVAEAAELLHDALDESESTQLVLLLDESVAAEHGAELARLLAQDPALSPTRVVLLSRDPESVPPTGHGFPLTAILRKPLLRSEALLEALQAKPGADAPRPSSSRAPFLAGADHTARPRPHVLVVDDDNISRSVSSQLLALLGCQVKVAESGPAAIAHAGTQAFDLIFMDCQMPGMDGYEATQKILAATDGKAPPIVALTANTSARDRERCLAAGMSDFIAKPVHKTELARILRRWTRPETVRTK